MSYSSFSRQVRFFCSVLGAVVLVHLIMLAFLFVQHLQPTPEGSSEGSVRVQLSVQQPAAVPQVAEPTPPTPVQPKVTSKTSTPVVASQAPKDRVVSAPAEVVPEMVKPTIAPPVQVAAAPAPTTAASAAASSVAKESSTKVSDAVDNRPVSKSINQLSCHVPKPEYPRSAKRLNQSGNVQVRLVINEQGRLISAEVIGSGSGFPALDQAALAAARSAVCQPFVDENGRLRVVTTEQPFNFSPDN